MRLWVRNQVMGRQTKVQNKSNPRIDIQQNIKIPNSKKHIFLIIMNESLEIWDIIII